MKKALSLSMALAMSAAMLAGCGGSASGSTSASGTASSADSAASGTPTVSFMIPDFTGHVLSNEHSDEVIAKYEAYTGTHVEWRTEANDTYSEKFGLTLMDKDNMPMILTATKTLDQNANAADAAKRGAFWDLTEYLQDSEAYPNLSQISPDVLKGLTVDGQIIGIPRSRAIGRNGLGYRTDWAEAVGITEAPKTVEDVYDMLYKFTYDDPDGNGANDTYGLEMCKYTGPWDIIQTWFGCGNGWVEQDGKQAPMAYYYKDGSTAFPSSGKNFNYIHGGLGPKATFADCKVLDGLLTGDDQIYHIRVTLDFTTRKISFTVTDAADPSKSQTVSDLAMDPSVDYADNVGALVFSHYFSSAASWTTSIDNFSVYGTSVAPASIEYTVDCVNLNAVDGIKLVPVEGALSATAKLSPTVYPTAADQTVIYTVSDELKDWITVASDGTITIKPDKNVLYDQAATVDKVSGSIRIQSAVDETIFQDVKVLVGPPNTNEKLTLTVNGTEYSETAMQFPVGQAVDLGFAATGGDGNSDLFRYKWTIAENTAGAILDGNTLTAKQEGTVTLNFVIDFFRGETTKTIELVFADKAEPPVDPDEPDSPEEGGDPSDPDQPDTPQGGGDSSSPEQPTPAEPQQPDQGDSGQTTSRPDDKKAVTAQNVSEISEPNSITQPSSIPQTADPFPLGLCLLITAASFGALILLLLLKYDRRSTQNK